METATKSQPLCEQIGRERLVAVINAFYDRLMADAILGHHFRALGDLEAHKTRIVDFWWIGMGGESDDPPMIDMIGKHRFLRISRSEINRWLGVFTECVRAELPEELAAQWIYLAEGIGRKLTRCISPK